jgi:DNA-binding transcriptional ArsR family regulator
MTGTDQLSRVFSALADPTRRAILAELAERDATVTELSAPFPMSMPAVSRHLKVLEEDALISRRQSTGSTASDASGTCPSTVSTPTSLRFKPLIGSTRRSVDVP